MMYSMKLQTGEFVKVVHFSGTSEHAQSYEIIVEQRNIVILGASFFGKDDIDLRVLGTPTTASYYKMVSKVYAY